MVPLLCNRHTNDRKRQGARTGPVVPTPLAFCTGCMVSLLA